MDTQELHRLCFAKQHLAAKNKTEQNQRPGGCAAKQIGTAAIAQRQELAVGTDLHLRGDEGKGRGIYLLEVTDTEDAQRARLVNHEQACAIRRETSIGHRLLHLDGAQFLILFP